MWSFTTTLGSAALELMSPKAGANGVSLAPVFQWSAVSGAESYEMVVSTDSRFTDSVIHRRGALALPATAWQSDTELEYGETYFWKVRGLSSNSFSVWSAVGAFTTATPPPEPEPAEPEPAEPEPAEPEETNPAPAEPEETGPAPQDEPVVEPTERAETIPVQFEPPPALPVVMPTVEVAIPTWALAAVVGLLATLVLLLITVLVVVGRVRRY